MSVLGTNYSNRFGDVIGTEYPYIRVRDYVCGKGDIVSVRIDTGGFLPTIEIKLNMYSNTLNELNKLNDGDLIQVGIRTDMKVFKPIAAEFIVTNVISNSIIRNNVNYRYTIFGELFVPYLDTEKIKFQTVGIGEDALKECAGRIGLGYVQNTHNPKSPDYNKRTNSTNKEIWNCVHSPKDFIQDVTQHMWAGVDSFFDSWIDLQYNLVNVNVNDMLGRHIDDDGTIDLTKYRTYNQTAGSDGAYVHNDYKTISQNPDLKLFTNKDENALSVWYVHSYKLVNNSTEISKKIGVQRTKKIYLQNNGKGQSENDSEYTVNMGVWYNKEKLALGYTILNGPTNYDIDYKHSDNGSYKDQNTKTENVEVQHVLSDIDFDEIEKEYNNEKASGNFSKGYVLAPEHNYINLMELEKQNVILNCQGFNTGVARGEKVPVTLYRLGNEKFVSGKQNFPDNSYLMDAICSGWFYVKGITYSYKQDSNPRKSSSNWVTSIVLTRREWFPPLPVSTAAAAGDVAATINGTTKLNAVGDDNSKDATTYQSSVANLDDSSTGTSGQNGTETENSAIGQEQQGAIKNQQDNQEAISKLNQYEELVKAEEEVYEKTEELLKDVIGQDMDDYINAEINFDEIENFNTPVKILFRCTDLSWLQTNTANYNRSRDITGTVNDKWGKELAESLGFDFNDTEKYEIVTEIPTATSNYTRANTWIEAVRIMAAWYVKYVQTYQGDSDTNGEKGTLPKPKSRYGGRQYSSCNVWYYCPLLGNSWVRDDCSGFVCACLRYYMGSLGDETKLVYANKEMCEIFYSKKEASPFYNKLKEYGFEIIQIDGTKPGLTRTIEDITPVKTFKARLKAFDIYSGDGHYNFKGNGSQGAYAHHCEIWATNDKTFGWGKIQSGLPTRWVNATYNYIIRWVPTKDLLTTAQSSVATLSDEDAETINNNVTFTDEDVENNTDYIDEDSTSDSDTNTIYSEDSDEGKTTDETNDDWIGDERDIDEGTVYQSSVVTIQTEGTSSEESTTSETTTTATPTATGKSWARCVMTMAQWYLNNCNTKNLPPSIDKNGKPVNNGNGSHGGYSQNNFLKCSLLGNNGQIRPDCSGFVWACLLLYGVNIKVPTKDQIINVLRKNGCTLVENGYVVNGIFKGTITYKNKSGVVDSLKWPYPSTTHGKAVHDYKVSKKATTTPTLNDYCCFVSAMLAKGFEIFTFKPIGKLNRDTPDKTKVNSNYKSWDILIGTKTASDYFQTDTATTGHLEIFYGVKTGNFQDIANNEAKASTRTKYTCYTWGDREITQPAMARRHNYGIVYRLQNPNPANLSVTILTPQTTSSSKKIGFSPVNLNTSSNKTEGITSTKLKTKKSTLF